MRIHRIDILNLASLYGAHSVDLDTQLGGAGLFLIHGPMGSGKTTLLDAICLALFGRTPRLIESGTRKQAQLEDNNLDSPVHLMSRGTGHSQATVEFSLPDANGVVSRYRATWELRRARNRPDGKHQDVMRRLVRLGADGAQTILVDSEKVKTYEPVFNGVLRGLTFDDFARTVMLAQFAFQQFLLASAEERAKLLERLTESERFKSLGLAASESFREAKAALDTLRAQVEGTRVLPDAEEAALRTARADRANRLDALRGQAVSLDAVRRFFAEAARLQLEVDQAATHRAQAESELTALAPEAERLRRHGLAAPAMAALTAWEARGAALKRAQEDVRAAVEATRVSAEAVDLQAIAQAAFDAALQGAMAARDAETPALEAADGLWQAWRSAAAAVTERANEARERARTRAEVEAKLAEATVLATEAAAKLEATRTERAQIPHADALARALAGLTSGRAHAASLRKTAREWQAESVDAEGRRAKGEREVAALEADLPRRASAGLDAERRAATAAEALAAIGGGEPAARRDAARAEVVRAQARGGALDRAVEAERKRAEALAEAEVARTEAARTAEVASAAAVAVANTQSLLEAAQATRDAVERELRHIDRQLGVVDRRDALVEGEACPLCGGHDHPYRLDPLLAPTADTLHAEHRAADGRRVEWTERIAALNAELRRVDARRVENSAQATAATRRVEDLTTVAAERAFERSTAALEAAWPAERPAEDHRAALLAEADAAERLAEAIDNALAESRTCQGELDDALRRALELDERLVEVRERLDESTVAAASAVTRAAEAAALAEVAEAEQVAAFRAVGIEAPTLDAALETAQRRHDEAERLALKEAADRQRAEDAVREVTRFTEARDAAVNEATTAEAKRLSAEAELASALEGTRRYFDGADPAAVRQRLNTSVEQAQSAATESERKLADARTKHAADEARRSTLEQAAEAAARDEDTAKADYLAAEAAAGARSVDEVRAWTLPEAERAALAQRQDQATELRSRRAAVHEDMQRQWARHAEARPADAEGDLAEAASLAHLAEVAHAALGQEIESALADLSRDDAALAANERARETLAGLGAAIATAETEHDAWKAIHDTIGTNNGDAFVVAVQSLNLRALLDRANARLAQFLGRYRLEQIVEDQGALRIDFWLLDAYQQDARRPTRSLSGGESFIVALALALGLADLRAARFRIETLLIDEGFGAVDQQTLRDILGVLEALRDQSGTRIGVISHVEMMKEAIPAQIEVVRNDDGRSSRLVVRG